MQNKHKSGFEPLPLVEIILALILSLLVIGLLIIACVQLVVPLHSDDTDVSINDMPYLQSTPYTIEGRPAQSDEFSIV